MVEVFKTNVLKRKEAAQIVRRLEERMIDSKINFDLEDCDKVLRIERAGRVKNNLIIDCLKQLGYDCEVLQ